MSEQSELIRSRSIPTLSRSAGGEIGEGLQLLNSTLQFQEASIQASDILQKLCPESPFLSS
jgi:hypothetical protein